MLPFAAAACLLRTQAGLEQECSLLSCSALEFTFRLPLFLSLDVKSLSEIELRFHLLHGDQVCLLHAFAVDLEEQTADSIAYRVTPDDPDYPRCARAFMQEYQQYTQLKLAGDDAHLSAVLTGYPASAEQHFPESLSAQRHAWLQALRPDIDWLAVASSVREIAIPLTSPASWQRYLTSGITDFTSWFWRKLALTNHPLTSLPINTLYIGNAFCPLLFPDQDTLLKLLDRAASEHITPVLSLAAIPQNLFPVFSERICSLKRWCEKHGTLEIVVNDWGMLNTLHQESCFRLTMGILLNKRRKDPRMSWMQAASSQKAMLAEQAISAPFFRDWLSDDMHITRISLESCGYPLAPSPFPASLHLPFYQTNTSGTCALYAECRHHQRGHQQVVSNCPQYCQDHAFLYPSELNMTSRWNSIFGYDAAVLQHSDVLRSLLQAGVDRLVLEFLL